MTTKRTREYFRALDAKANAIIFDGGKCRLWDTAEFSQLILAKALQLTQDAHRFANRNRSTLLGGAKILHLGPPTVMCSNGHDLKNQFVGKDTVKHSKLRTKARRSMALPDAGECFVVESGDLA